MDSKNIIVTGSSGFIGSYLCKKLEQQGHQVIKVDLKLGSNILSMPVYEDIDIVFHLAAQTRVQESVVDPYSDALTNIIGTLNVIKAYPNSKIIYPGSAASIEIQSPYGLSKRVAGEYLALLHTNYVICNFPNVYGEGGHGVVEAFKEADTVIVNGDGSQTRSFVHVTDIVEGLIQAMEWEGEYWLGEQPVSIKELAQSTGKPIVYGEPLPGEVLFSEIENTTPNWLPTINVLEYVRD